MNKFVGTKQKTAYEMRIIDWSSDVCSSDLMLISGVIGSTLGIAAGYFGGRVDMIITFIITTRLCMPVVLVALAVVAIVGNTLQVVITVLGLLIWDRFAVVMRSSTQQVRNLDYVAAAEAAGCSTRRILLTEDRKSTRMNSSH